jgi:hypothetical protein
MRVRVWFIVRGACGACWCVSLCVQRDANETKTETKELIFQAPAIWPALVPPLVVLGVAVVLLVVRLVFNIIDKRIATARAHQEALRIASEGTIFFFKVQLRVFTRST